MDENNNIVRSYCSRRHSDVIFNLNRLGMFPCGYAQVQDHAVECLRSGEDDLQPCTAYAYYIQRKLVRV